VQRQPATHLLVAGAAYGISYRRIEGLARSAAKWVRPAVLPHRRQCPGAAGPGAATEPVPFGSTLRQKW